MHQQVAVTARAADSVPGELAQVIGRQVRGDILYEIGQGKCSGSITLHLLQERYGWVCF